MLYNPGRMFWYSLQDVLQLVTHLTQNVPKALLKNLVEPLKPHLHLRQVQVSGRCVTSVIK